MGKNVHEKWEKTKVKWEKVIEVGKTESSDGLSN